MRITKGRLVPKQQQYAILTQNNPVSGMEYTVLDTTPNVELLSIAGNITWAVTQPNPLTIKLYIDAATLICIQANPVSTQNYKPFINPIAADSVLGCFVTSGDYRDQIPIPFLPLRRSVKVTIAVTWAITQPTPLVCVVRYAKL